MLTCQVVRCQACKLFYFHILDFVYVYLLFVCNVYFIYIFLTAMLYAAMYWQN